MAIYHFSAKMISRGSGSSALAAAAYRSASRLHNQRLDRHHDFSNKAGVIHSEVMLPDGAPEEWHDREKLWNAAEAAELRKDAQLAREVEFAIPREMDQSEGIRLARDYVEREFVARGMVADLNVHWDVGADGEARPHAHVMVATRSVSEDGFGAKVRDWNRTDLLEHWREAWADHVNARLAELDIEARIDHRSLEAQGIDLEPQHKIGPAASRMAGQGLASERLDEHAAIARANGEKILASPSLAIDAITHGQATFTTRDLARIVHRHSEGREQFDKVMAAVKASPQIVRIGRDGRGEDRFTSRDMLQTEQRLEAATVRLDARRHYGVEERHREAALARAATRGLVLSSEQSAAFERMTDARGLSVVVGYAGTGKSAMLGVAREAWEASGYRVQGAALSGIAAENLESGSGISSRTIASLERQWEQGWELLGSRDVLVLDEAGMIGTRQMERVIAEVERRGAKVVLVGDPEQLQAIEAGAAFRSIHERHGGVEIMEVRRQREDWQRQATRQLATGRTAEAIQAYDTAGHVHAAETREATRVDLIDRWDRDRRAAPGESHMILTHTNDEVRTLNLAARDRLRKAGELGKEVVVRTERGERSFAPADRIMFLRNERSLGVKNGSLGTVESVSQLRMAVLLDDGRSVAFDMKDYADLDHGYAATIHKSQGVTVDRVHVLATPGLDRHAAYVALSRHRDVVELHYGRDDFSDRSELARTLGRERAKDMASDYTRDFADHRQIRLPASEQAKPALVRDPFAGLDLRPVSSAPTRGMFDDVLLPALGPVSLSQPVGLESAVQRFARATEDIVRMRKGGHAELAHQRIAFEKARDALNAVRPHGAHDLREAFVRDGELIGEAARGRTTAALRAMVLEAEMRVSPERRADRFVGDWQKLAKAYNRIRNAGDEAGIRAIGQQMNALGKSLERDAQAESLVKKRLPSLGIHAREGASLSHSIQDWITLSRDRGIGR
ncbi:Ti-type conjugative transfer relaxase TraA [Sphingomonas sp. AP4-R1]|uniref:Ti-type conjugative transfer relaxase TraA n=1 Tax=Sphingomonas sp. AP4-R1 TaxID=2735134 RepID=UPI00149360D7|nr:Ti-type conjugative transfer relaxase TraA [Sphingomonas sp. AP4-R1]QJU57398.1 Ti-type conjugative transfer relaxase TraA [Sphingomonas sp. AP4-R1]